MTAAPAPQTAQEWCDHYGVEVEDGVATLYKAVDADFNSYHGMSYRPGTQPQAPDWDGGEEECGGGIHLSPRPGLALPRTYGARRFVACPGARRGHRHPPRRRLPRHREGAGSVRPRLRGGRAGPADRASS